MMSITEIISATRALTQDEKRKLAQTLLEELANESEAVFQDGHVYPIYTPEFAPNAASQLAQLLEADEKLR